MERTEWKNKLTAQISETDTPWQIHEILGKAVQEYIAENWKKSQKNHNETRHACYFSMEFLVGRAVYNNLLALGLTEDVEQALSAKGHSLNELEEIEDAALGNGGLGRLAACFLESAATLNLPLDGYGIRYKYGLFRQKIVDGFQKEVADDWSRFGDPWSVRKEDESVIVNYRDLKVKAVPYDMPVVAYGTNHVGTLRLWQAEAAEGFCFDDFNNQKYFDAVANQIYAENISRCLYPNDNGAEGKKLRLQQQYFFCSASLQHILKQHFALYHNFDNLAEQVVVQLNDTHPVISIPEVIRLLTQEYQLRFDDAFAIAKKMFRYTNHTIMAEALETWDTSLMEELIPDVYKIILQINEMLLAERYLTDDSKEDIDGLSIIQGGRVHMARLAIYMSVNTNGVARIHTEILKNTALHNWYERYPERFLNETNGITQRRWLALCNPGLSALLSELSGNQDWILHLEQLKQLEKYAEDTDILNRFLAIKAENKQKLCAYIQNKESVKIDSDWIFDVQIKRLHEYKRQLLNAFSILWIYYGILDGSIQDFIPTVFLFGAKSAPGYRRAKAIIKFIGEISKMIAKDERVNHLIQVHFVENYDVSYAEKIVAATDVSEQISTAGTEASGTGNMKLMLNGAVTLGTYDGANVEIVEEAGEDVNYIFGARVEELETIMPNYVPRKLLAQNDKIRRVLNTLIDGTFTDGGSGDFRELYEALTDGASWHVPDHYYLLGDLESYVEAKLRVNKDYKNRLAFARKQWINLCNAGKFSSDRTIEGYAKDIWQITPVEG